LIMGFLLSFDAAGPNVIHDENISENFRSRNESEPVAGEARASPCLHSAQ
jgi:hypothetical protein